MIFQQIGNTGELRPLGKENAVRDARGKLSIATPRPILSIPSPTNFQHDAARHE
jgi:hypothetical protein